MSKNDQGKYSFNPVSVNFMIEVAKTIYALVTLIIFVSRPWHNSAPPHLAPGQGHA